MQLNFIGGTVVLEQLNQGVEVKGLQHLKWDERVSAYRGPAFLVPLIYTELLARGFCAELPAIKNQKPVFQADETALRPYQSAALSAWEIAGFRGTVVLPTGSGKTLVAAAAIRKVGRATLIIVPTLVLLRQWAAVLDKNLGIQTGTFGDGERHIKPVTIATFESAYRHMAWLGDKFDFIVVDEVHHFGGGIRDEALEMSMASFRLGLTATPAVGEEWHQGIARILGPVVYQLDLHDLRGTYLSDFEVVRIHLELNPKERAAYETGMTAFRRVNEVFRADYPRGSWKDFIFYASRTEAGRGALKGLQTAQRILYCPECKHTALGSILGRHTDDKVLIFTPDTATAYEISRRHLIMPLTSDVARKEREDALSWFRSGEISALVSCQVLNEGFDVPDANVAIILGGRRGEREHLQRVGRILRWKDGRKAKIFELVCNRTLEIRQANRRGQRLDSGIDSLP